MTHGNDFRSLGNALYPELALPALAPFLNFRSLGNALYPERLDEWHAFEAILDHWEMRSIRNLLFQFWRGR